ncbi:MAG: DNA polymerase III subunit gamma/tau [Verrucomicrobia bacterium]|jgi:DNA polymerase III subunit gamma/tau|nr:DNA polymerase III subunit gamma/tau [Verrucomicrobiota bacterium]
MAYQVIARKYRPQRFEDVVGQDHVTRTLSHAIEMGRIAHAYLFCGPRGTGKTTLARIFAKCLNCTDGPSTTFPEDDERCTEIAEGRSLDVLEIDGASNRGIEEIRELRDTVRYAPASSKFKIYIIDEVHMLTKEAFNALLKTLEEPPEHAKFMFATTEPEKVLPTILSRCQRFDLRRIPSSLIVKHLIYIASLEGVEVEEAALQAVARGADGGMRDAESTLDQLISFCGSKIVEADVLSMFGMASRDQVLQLGKAIIDGDSLTVLQTVELLTSEGKELGRLLSDLLSFFRNLMLFQLSNENPDLVQVSEAEMGVLRELAGKLVPERLARLLEVLSDCDYRMKGASAKRIFFEVALIKAIEAVQSVPLNEVLKTLKSLRSDSPVEIPATSGAKTRAVSERPSAPVPSPVPSPKVVERKPETPRVAPVLTPTVAPPPVSAAVSSKPLEPVSQPNDPERPASGNVDLESLWPKVLSYVEAKSPFTHSYLKVAKPLGLNGRSLTIGFPPQAKDSMALLEGGKNKVMLSDALNDSGLEGCQIRFVEAAELSDHFEEQKAAAAAAPPKASRPRSQDSSGAGGASGPVEPEVVDLAEFRNDPLIKEALEIFKGQIVQTGTSS